MNVAMITADINTEEGRGIFMYSEETVQGLKMKNIKMDLLFYQRGSLVSLLNLIPKLKKYDVVHIQHEYGLFGPLAGIKFMPFLIALSFFTNAKIVITMHTIHDKKEKLFHKILPWLWVRTHIIYPLQNKLIGFFSNGIVVHTKFLGEKLIKSYGIKKQKIFVIPHGVRQNIPLINKSEAKRKLKIKGDVYLMIGNITPSKGFDLILKQASKIGGNIVLFGRTDNKIYLDSLKKSVQKKANVIIDTEMDPIGTGDKKWWLYLSSADLILLPYRTMTTSGVFITAMQAHKPVVTSNTLYFEEINSKYKCLSIVKNKRDYPKLIKKTMKNLNLMENESKRFSQENSFFVLSKKYDSLYSQILFS